MANSNAYMNDYMKRRYHERRQIALRELGGKCVICGSVDELQFDHIDPTAKSFSVSKMWSTSMTRFMDEIRKCQILCHRCHKMKHLKGQWLSNEQVAITLNLV